MSDCCTDSFSPADHQAMARAIQLASHGLFTTDPNPRVGAVIVRDGKVVGEGWHQLAGEPHAEVHALSRAGALAKGATAYVTLEPCAHFGKTPPCAKALIQAGVSRVVFASVDPNPLVAGKGAAMLRSAGIDVASGLMDKQARSLNPGFFSRFEKNRPYIRIKVASSVDGRTAMASGESQWITGEPARKDVQRLRARSSAVITGGGTVRMDDPRLNVRPEMLVLDDTLQGLMARKKQPDCYVLSTRGECFERAALWKVARRNCLVVPAEGVRPDGSTLPPGVEILEIPGRGAVDLDAFCRFLGTQSVNEVLVEAGPGLAGAFLAAGLFDELWVYMAPVLLGSSARPMFQWEIQRMSEKRPLELVEIRHVGADLRMIYRQDGAQG